MTYLVDGERVEFDAVDGCKHYTIWYPDRPEETVTRGTSGSYPPIATIGPRKRRQLKENTSK